jgi:hypothetical protein
MRGQYRYPISHGCGNTGLVCGSFRRKFAANRQQLYHAGIEYIHHLLCETTVSGCVSTRTAVTATVNPIPAAPTAASSAICTGSSVTLTATAPGGTYTWYDVASGGSVLQTGASFITPVLTVNTSYYVQTVVSGCTSARTTVTISVNSTPPFRWLTQQVSVPEIQLP